MSYWCFSMLRTLLALALGAALATDAVAQCQAVANSGCPGVPPPFCSGSSRLGHSITFVWNPGGLPFGRGVVLAGLPAVTPLTIGPAAMCSATSCVIAVDPTAMVVLPTGFTGMGIPNDPALVQLVIRFQAAFNSPPGPGHCVFLSQAAQIVIQA